MTENGTAGMMVMTMTAIDYDDLEEGTNAKLKYSIEKNVIDENTGTPIFEIEEDTGVIKTAVCCLDREKTPDYSIQVHTLDYPRGQFLLRRQLILRQLFWPVQVLKCTLFL